MSRRQLHWPTRAELRDTSRWVWLLLVIAVLYAVARLLTTGLSVGDVISAGLGYVELLAAAALMYVAPREKLVMLAAFAFAEPSVIRLIDVFFKADNHDILRMSAAGYFDLQQPVLAATAFVGSLSWVFGLIAVLALAFYIGPVRSRAGWLLVLVGVVLATADGIQIILTRLPFIQTFEGDPLPDGFDAISFFVIPLVARLTTIATAYLAACALDHRMRLLALSYGLELLLGFVGLLSFVAASLYVPFESADLPPAALWPGDWILGVYWILGVVTSILLIGGILLELPRKRARATGVSQEQSDAAATAPPSEAFSGAQ